jgi:hypothetical protein
MAVALVHLSPPAAPAVVAARLAAGHVLAGGAGLGAGALMRLRQAERFSSHLR